jgi:hypothetical protein
MRKMKFVSMFVLLTLLLSATSGAVMAQERPPEGESESNPHSMETRSIVGSISVPKDTSAYDYADSVRDASDHGCDDHWAVFYSTYPDLPTGVWADNAINQWHINDNGGLNGYFRCNPSGSCTTYLCTKHGTSANAWTVKVRW